MKKIYLILALLLLSGCSINYNLSISSYLKTNDREITIDIKEVNNKLAEVVPKQQQIRKELEEIIKELEVDYHE